MRSEELWIEIGRDGKVRVETAGMKGPECLVWVELLERVVGRIEAVASTGESYEGAVRVEPRARAAGGRRGL